MKMVWIIIATSLIAAGILVFLVALVAANFNFAQMFNGNYETNTYEISENFDHLSVDIDTADITFLPSADGKCKVVCYEQKKIKHAVTVKDETLIIEEIDSRRWYEYIGINFGTPTVTVYLPETEHKKFKLNTHTGDVNLPSVFKFDSIEIAASTADIECKASSNGLLKITTTTGDIKLEEVSVGELVLSVSTGDIDAKSVNCAGKVWVYVSTGKTKLNNLNCKALTSDGDTGDIRLSNVLVSENLSVTRDTGDVLFENSDANEIVIKTSTGDVKGSLRSPKIFITQTSTGNVKVPESTVGGKCRINTSTGNISISVK